MIVQRIINWFNSVLVSVLVSLPALPEGVVTALDGLPGAVATVTGYGSRVSFIVPWALLAAAAGVYLVCVAAAVAIRIARMVVSHVTGGGGSL